MKSTHTIKINNTQLTFTITDEGQKAGLTGIYLDGKKFNNFRTTDTGYRTGTALFKEYPEAIVKQYGMAPDSAGRLQFPLTMKPEAVAEAIIRYTMEPKVAKAEAKAEAKAKAEKEAEAKATKAKAEKAPRANTRKVTAKATKEATEAVAAK